MISVFYRGSRTYASSSSSINVTVDARVGPEFRVNTVTAGAQEMPSIARLADRGFVVVWQSNLEDGSEWGIFGQRYKADGKRVGGAFLVNTTRAGSQTHPSVAGTSSGGFVVTWTSENRVGTSHSVRAQRFGARGVKLGGELLVSPAARGEPSVIALRKGAFAIVWASELQGGGSRGIRGRLYNAAGVPTGAEIKIGPAISGTPANPSAAALANGGFVVAWKEGRSVYAQRFNSAGIKAGRALRVVSADRGQLLPVVTAACQWRFRRRLGADNSGVGVHGRRYRANGTPAGAPFAVNKAAIKGQQPIAATGLPGGGFAVLWSSVKSRAAALDVFGQTFDGAGKRSGAEFTVNTKLAKNQSQPAVAPLGGRGFVAAWSSRGQDGSLEGVYGQRFDFGP